MPGASIQIVIVNHFVVKLDQWKWQLNHLSDDALLLDMDIFNV